MWGDAKPVIVETDGHFLPSNEIGIADFGLSKTVDHHFRQFE